MKVLTGFSRYTVSKPLQRICRSSMVMILRVSKTDPDCQNRTNDFQLHFCSMTQHFLWWCKFIWHLDWFLKHSVNYNHSIMSWGSFGQWIGVLTLKSLVGPLCSQKMEEFNTRGGKSKLKLWELQQNPGNFFHKTFFRDVPFNCLFYDIPFLSRQNVF